MIQAVRTDTFEQEVLGAGSPVLVDFWATWCGPCRMVAPIIDEIAANYAGRVKVVKVDVDEAPELAERFGIASIPTVMLFRDGQEANRWVGVQRRSVYVQALDQLG
jgi:thioredoxin 1